MNRYLQLIVAMTEGKYIWIAFLHGQCSNHYWLRHTDTFKDGKFIKRDSFYKYEGLG